VAGASVELAAGDTASPAFVAPAVGVESVLAFELTVSDGAVDSTDRVSVTVDPSNQAPKARAGDDQTVRAGSVVTLDGRGSSDPDADPLTYRWTQVGGPPVVLSSETAAEITFTAPEVGPAGETLSFELVVSDGLADSAPARVAVRVLAEDTGPLCVATVADPSVLWPPNHKMVAVALTGFAGKPKDPQHFTVRILKVTQDEPVNGTGDGDTGPDAIVNGSTVLLRAERAGTGNGRVYQIKFRVTAISGGTCTGTAWVGVPHSSRTAPVDDGQKFDATLKPPKAK
jgi:hypothetical protein